MAETVLVTGGAGFVGSFIVDDLVHRGHKVIVYDALDRQVHAGGRPEYLNPEAEFVEADIRDRDRLAASVARADLVSHQAAVVGVGQSMYQVDRYVDVNTRGTAVLLDVLVNSPNHVRKLVIPGSMSAYGEGAYGCPRHGLVRPRNRTDDQMAKGDWEFRCDQCGDELRPRPTSETKGFEANSVYAITKQSQEQLALSVGQAYRIPTVALRYFNIFGPRQSLNNPYTGVAAIFISQLKNGHRPQIFEDGRQTRDFISVHDIVSANVAAMDDSRADYKAFNVGAGRQITILQLARTLAALLAKDIEPQITGKYRTGDIRHCVADISSIAKSLDWAPLVSLENGLKELVEWSDTVGADDRVEGAAEELRARGLLAE